MKKSAMLVLAIILGVSIWDFSNAQMQKEIPAKPGKAPDRIIYLKARQFSFSPDIIKVKQGEKVRIIAESLDVTHGFAISEFNVNAVIEPGKKTVIEFVASKKGAYDFVCSVYCGAGHSHMKGKLIVE